MFHATSQACSASEERVLALLSPTTMPKCVGLDGYMLLRTIRVFRRITLFATFYGAAVLVPVYGRFGTMCRHIRMELVA